MSVWGTGRTFDPVNAPEEIPLGDWWGYHLQAVAHCKCGRVVVVHRAELLKRFNHYQPLGPEQVKKLPLKCIRCGARDPEIALEVRKD